MTDRYPEGMSLRDWFAGMAMQGFVETDGYAVDRCAELAYAVADKMIEERIKQYTPDD